MELPKVTTGIYAPDQLDLILQDIEYNYNVKLSIDCIKTYIVDTENYNNSITVFEFSPRKVQNKNVSQKNPDFRKTEDCLRYNKNEKCISKNPDFQENCSLFEIHQESGREKIE